MVTFLDIVLSTSSRKVFSHPCSFPWPSAARSGPSRIQSDSSLTRLWVLLIKLHMLRCALSVGRLIAWICCNRKSASSTLRIRNMILPRITWLAYHTERACYGVYPWAPCALSFQMRCLAGEKPIAWASHPWIPIGQVSPGRLVSRPNHLEDKVMRSCEDIRICDRWKTLGLDPQQQRFYHILQDIGLLTSIVSRQIQ